MRSCKPRARCDWTCIRSRSPTSSCFGRSLTSTRRLAGPADILLIIEIAASSIDFDREVKAPLYARAGVPEYWIADLNANVIWRYESPESGTYQHFEECHRGQSIAPRQLPTCALPVDAFLIE
jgi:Uma2 family endonuclease